MALSCFLADPDLRASSKMLFQNVAFGFLDWDARRHDGTGADYVTFTLNGVKLPVTSPIGTTYTLNPDCTGTKTVLNGPRFDIYVARDGSELTVIATAAPPNQSSGFAVSARQVRAGFDRQE
jgi:hypothetical protein